MTDQPHSADEPNEIVALAKAAKDHSVAAARVVNNRASSWPLAKIGLGVGIGSAAIAGAVLFVTRNKGDQ